MANLNPVKFYEDTYNAYVTAKNEGLIDESALYFLDNGQLFKGTRLITNVRLVLTAPTKGDPDTVYINKASGQITFWNGLNYQDIFTPVDEITDSTDNQIPTAKAVKDYVASRGSVLSFESYADFPISGEENILYIDKLNNKTYRYSTDRNYYIVGSDYNEISEIHGEF
jgi:hypothetical protein